MFKKKTHSRPSSLIRIACSVLFITFVLGSSACNNGDSSTSSNALPQPSVNCGGSSCIQ